MVITKFVGIENGNNIIKKNDKNILHVKNIFNALNNRFFRFCNPFFELKIRQLLMYLDFESLDKAIFFSTVVRFFKASTSFGFIFNAI